MPIEDVPGWQKRIIREARIHGKPVVVSTQMLESMITSKTPTRAEVSDVATAVFEGSDAVMLSAESAIGDNPELAVKMMNKIAHSVEKNPNYSSILLAQLEETPEFLRVELKELKNNLDFFQHYVQFCSSFLQLILDYHLLQIQQTA